MAIDPRDITKFFPGASGIGRRISDRIEGREDERDDEDDDERDEGKGSGRETEIWTIFTKPGGTNLIAAPKTWSRVRLSLTTAGPVVVGNKHSLHPVTSGLGIMLSTDVPLEFVLSGGSRLYYAADAANRLSVVVEPVPWLEQIAHSIGSLKRVFKGK